MSVILRYALSRARAREREREREKEERKEDDVEVFFLRKQGTLTFTSSLQLRFFFPHAFFRSFPPLLAHSSWSQLEPLTFAPSRKLIHFLTKRREAKLAPFERQRERER